MPLSLAKMPTAARQVFSSLVNLFSASTSEHHAATGERRKKPNLCQVTPEPNRRESTPENKMNGTETEVVNHGASCSPPSSSSSEMDHWEPDDYEKELVKRTWSDDFDFLYELGSKIYQHIFDTNPHTKELFPSIHRHGADWKNSKEFRAQALKFVQTLSHTVKNLYHMELQKDTLHKIGERHVAFSDRGFKPEYWDVFQDSMEFALSNHIAALPDLTEQQKADATSVWRTLALYVTTHMKKGYFDLLENKKNGSK
uniref:GLOBIN domain-containing protein n=1 Tax=Steinernema glaseri TaxID=37863 RepID=A0A1I8A5Z1_9BILA